MHIVRIDLHNLKRERVTRVHVDPQHLPTRISAPHGNGPDIYLDWNQTLDDRGRLRRCPVCGCPDLYRRKDYPQVTGFAIIVLAAVVSVALWSYHLPRAALVILAVLILTDLLIFFFSPHSLVCYRCHSTYRKLPIDRRHPGWDSTVDERYRRS